MRVDGAEPSAVPLAVPACRGVIQRSNRFCESPDPLASAISSLEIGRIRPPS